MTQTQLIIEVCTGEEKSIKEISSELDILEPNVRRILGQGTKKGIFNRIAPGIYTITVGDKTKAIIKCGDALEEIKKLKNASYKFDMVFLDIPYKTVAVIGGNRGVDYSLISPTQFKEFLSDLKHVIHPQTYVYHMYSNAPSGWKQMKEYNDCFEKEGFKIQAQGGWQKTYKDGKYCSNMRGDVMPREGLALYSLTDIPVTNLQMNFESIRPKGKSEKCLSMLRQLVTQATTVGQRILDPFAGNGTTGEATLLEERNVMLIEKDPKKVSTIILPRLTKIIS